MSETFTTAFLILFVGMITIFLVLSLVVLSGNVLIRIVNAFHQEEKVVPNKAIRRSSVSSEKHGMEEEKLAAIIGAVEILTQGKGKIISIEKIN
ncbi:MAG: OadG family protein [Bacteroidia bacterium]|nr:OadG family protein [Bacteroidota bacterium]